MLRRVNGNTLWRILNGLHAAGYNSAESEPIWMKFGKLSARCWGLEMADFVRDPRSSHSLRGSRKKFRSSEFLLFDGPYVNSYE